MNVDSDRWDAESDLTDIDSERSDVESFYEPSDDGSFDTGMSDGNADIDSERSDVGSIYEPSDDGSFDMAVADGTARDIDMDAVAQRPFDYEAVITSQKSCLYQIQHEIRHTQGDPCPRTKTGYTGLPPATDPPPATVPKLNEVQETVFSGRKMKLVNWDGVTALPILTKEHRVIAIGAPRPLCPDWDDVHKGAFKKIFDIRNCQAPTNRRGAFSSLNFGFSYGFGHKKPRNRKQSSRHSKVVDALRCDSNVQRLAEAASDAFAGWAPKLFRQYAEYRQRLLNHDPTLQVNFEKSVWAAATVNFGPRTMCLPHLDSMNLACGWCAIIALGEFNPDKGGHLILWDLGLVIRFPPGSILLIPSALIRHSNVAIQDDERRASFTQYTPAGLFRWVDQGFQKQRETAKVCRIGPKIFSRIKSIIPHVRPVLL